MRRQWLLGKRWQQKGMNWGTSLFLLVGLCTDISQESRNTMSEAMSPCHLEALVCPGQWIYRTDSQETEWCSESGPLSLAGNDTDLMESFRLLERLKEGAQTIIKEMKSQRGNGIWSQVTRNKGLSCLTPRLIVLSCTSSCLRRVFLSLEKLISKDKIWRGVEFRRTEEKPKTNFL